MKRTPIFAATTILFLAAAPALAGQWDDNPDLRQSILNDVTSTGFVGTSLSTSKMERGSGDTYGWVVLDVQAGDVRPSAGREKGSGDTYGSILNDL